MSVSPALPSLLGTDPKANATDAGNPRGAGDALFALLFAAAGDAGALAGAPVRDDGQEPRVPATTPAEAEAAASDAALALIATLPLAMNAALTAAGNAASATAGELRDKKSDEPLADTAPAIATAVPGAAPNRVVDGAMPDHLAAAVARPASGATGPIAPARLASDAVPRQDPDAGTATPVPTRPAGPATLPEAAAAATRDAALVKATATETVARGADDTPPATTVVQNSAPRAEAGAATPVRVETPVAAPGWTAEIAQKLAPIVMLGHERAELQLNPAHLGPVEVKISFASDGASLVIAAADAGTRSALEQSLPQLRELFAAQGIALGQATVQSESRQPSQPFAPAAAARAEPAVTEPEPARAVLRIDRLVDVFV